MDLVVITKKSYLSLSCGLYCIITMSFDIFQLFFFLSFIVSLNPIRNVLNFTVWNPYTKVLNSVLELEQETS